MAGIQTTKAAPSIGAARARNIEALEERRREEATREERIAGGWIAAKRGLGRSHG